MEANMWKIKTLFHCVTLITKNFTKDRMITRNIQLR